MLNVKKIRIPITMALLIPALILQSVGVTVALAAPQNSHSHVRSDIQQDQNVAQRLVKGDMLYHVAEKNDANLAFIISRLSRAKTARDVEKIFADRHNGSSQPFIGWDETYKIIKARLGGVSGVRGMVINEAADGINEFLKSIANKKGPAKLEEMPKQMALMVLDEKWNQLPSEVRNEAVRQGAGYLGKNYDSDYVGKARDNRILRSQNPSAPPPEDERSQELLKEAQDILAQRLQLAKDDIENSRNERERAHRQQKLNKRMEHLEAGLFVTGLILPHLMGEQDAQNVQAVSTGFVKMYQAMEQFGPKGITPDKLLMFTNIVSAGLMVFSMMQSQEDPTMAALRAIMSQLADIQKQLERIEGKIDDLSDKMIMGFGLVLNYQRSIQDQIGEMRKTLDGQINDQAQKEALEKYLQYLEKDRSAFSLLLQCADPHAEKKGNALGCRDRFAEEFSDRTIFTLTPQRSRTPQILSPVWSNRLFTYKNVTQDRQLIYEQLSAPLYLGENADVMKSLIARNHEAIAAISEYWVEVPRTATPTANPEILMTYLQAYLGATQNHKQLRSKETQELTQQALNRVQDVEAFVKRTVGSQTVKEKLINLMAVDLNKYENYIRNGITEIRRDEFPSARKDFYRRAIEHCGQKLSSIHPPFDEKQGGLDKFVSQMYWMAQSMGLGRIGVCYEPGLNMKKRKDIGVRLYYPNTFEFKLFFNLADRANAANIGSAKESVRFNKDSHVFASRKYETDEFYTTYDSGTAPMFYYVWNGTQPHKLAYTCDKIFFSGLLTTGGPCLENVRRSAGHKEFIAKSKNTLSEDIVNSSFEIVKTEVEEYLAKVLKTKSEVWNPYNLQFEKTTPVKNPLDREWAKTDDLPQIMQDYTKKYLLMYNLLLVGFYHQNKVSICLAALNEYSPKQVEAQMEKLVLSDEISAFSDFSSKMHAAFKQCSEIEVHPQLKTLKTQLKDLKQRQMN
ncbi:MAG: hypothetical protein AB7O96_16695 [Pseudobdellovibrionaceae bacterium]